MSTLRERIDSNKQKTTSYTSSGHGMAGGKGRPSYPDHGYGDRFKKTKTKKKGK